MAQPAQTLHTELPSEVAQRVQLHLGTPVKELVMESTLRYTVRWYLLWLTFLAAFVIFVFLAAVAGNPSRMNMWVLGSGLCLLLLVGAWLSYFSAPFRRYSKPRTTHIYLCPNGLLGVRGGRIIYTSEWAQVHTVDTVRYGGPGKAGYHYLCKLHLVDGREIILKGTYQPVPHGLWNTDALTREIHRALTDYRIQQPG